MLSQLLIELFIVGFIPLYILNNNQSDIDIMDVLFIVLLSA